MLNLNQIPFFSNSVRLFFSLAAIWAIFVPCYTVCVIVNDYSFSSIFPSIYLWHGYEMIFGFFYTMIVGFILTASAHWTNKPAAGGTSLFLLFLFWVIEKASTLLGSSQISLIANIIFIVIFLYLLTKQLNKEKYPFLIFLLALSLLKTLILIKTINELALSSDYIYNISSSIIVLLVTIITGKIIPAFTQKSLKLKEKPTAPVLVERLTLLLTFLLPLTFIFNIKPSLQFFIYASCSMAHLLRLSFWHPIKAIQVNTIGPLHLANILFTSTLFYKTLTYFIPLLDTFRASFHLILMGGVTIIGANIMMRAGLGHTNRLVKFGKLELSVLVCLFLGVLIRVLLPIMNPNSFGLALHCGMGFWTLSFIIFLFKYFPFFLNKSPKNVETTL